MERPVLFVCGVGLRAVFRSCSGDGSEAELARSVVKDVMQERVLVPSELDVRLPISSFLISLRVFSPECVPFRLVSGFLAGSAVSNSGSAPSVYLSNSLDSGCEVKEVGVQVDTHLLSLHGVLDPSFHAEWADRFEKEDGAYCHSLQTAGLVDFQSEGGSVFRSRSVGLQIEEKSFFNSLPLVASE